MTQPPFEDQVQRWLRDAAAKVTPTRDPLPTFRAVVTQRSPRLHAAPPIQNVRALIGVMIIVTLFAATFALLRQPSPRGATLPPGLHRYVPTLVPPPLTPYPTIDPSTIKPAKHIQLRQDQIKLTFIAAYAFPTRTAIWLRGTYDATIGGGLMPDGVLTGPLGYTSQTNGGDFGHTTNPGAKLWSFDWHLYGDPLPPGAMSQPQTLNLTLTFTVFALNINQDLNEVIDGQWPLAFQVTPQETQAISFAVPAVTSAGITIRPISWESAPEAQQFDTYPQGGGRLVIDLRGFPQHTYLASIPGFRGDTNSPWGSSSGDSILTLGQDLPIGSQILTVNGGVPAPSPSILHDLREIGPNDVVRISVIFYQQVDLGQKTLDLLIENLMFRGEGSNIPTSLIYSADGPWKFTLPWT